MGGLDLVVWLGDWGLGVQEGGSEHCVDVHAFCGLRRVGMLLLLW